MSRSYREPWETDGYRAHSRRYGRGGLRRFWKRYSNRITRQDWSIKSGTEYKKNGYTYDICDYKFPCYPEPRLGYGIHSSFTPEYWEKLEKKARRK